MLDIGKFRREAERRKHARYAFSRVGWIDIGKGRPLILCMINDLSDTGARITIPSAQNLPKEFILLFTPQRGVGRRCRLIWQAGHDIGCKFTHRFVGSIELRISPG